MIKVSVIGATGYAGAELIRLLLSHSKVELKNLSSKSFVGKNINEIYPNLNKNLDKLLIDENEIFNDTDVVFASLPAGLSDEIANKCFEKKQTPLSSTACVLLLPMAGLPIGSSPL